MKVFSFLSSILWLNLKRVGYRVSSVCMWPGILTPLPLSHHCYPAGCYSMQDEADAWKKTVWGSWWIMSMEGWTRASFPNLSITTPLLDPAPKICSAALPAHSQHIVPHVWFHAWWWGMYWDPSKAAPTVWLTQERDHLTILEARSLESRYQLDFWV